MSQQSLSDSLAAALVRASDYKDRYPHEGAESKAEPITITISREPGAQGASVGRAVGQLLGWPVYDHELLDRIGKEMGTHVDMLKLIDEKPVGWLEQAVVSAISKHNLNQDSYMVHLVATVRGLAQTGHCIIVGRGATFILPGDSTLKVRLVADHKDRVANIKRTLNLSDKEATRWVEKTQHERHDFVKRHFGKDATDPHLYNLVLNSSRLSIEECAEIIAATLLRLQSRQQAGKPAVTV